LVDLEFAVHVTQLVHRTGFAPRLDDAIAALAGQGLVPAQLGEANDFLTRLLVTMRLLAPDAEPPGEATQRLIARDLRCADWPTVVASLDRTRQEVSACWRRMTGEDDGTR
jgi:glutamate-ammonia-ligase adenylyltransferase